MSTGNTDSWSQETRDQSADHLGFLIACHECDQLALRLVRVGRSFLFGLLIRHSIVLRLPLRTIFRVFSRSSTLFHAIFEGPPPAHYPRVVFLTPIIRSTAVVKGACRCLGLLTLILPWQWASSGGTIARVRFSRLGSLPLRD